MSDTGFHLGAGLYFGFDGHHHGEWRGELHVDGERIADCRDREAARRLHQIRDTVVRVTDSGRRRRRAAATASPSSPAATTDLGLTADTTFI